VSELRPAIEDVYRQVAAPSWARPNLDGLADVLRDLSWLPHGPVRVELPPRLGGVSAARLREVLDAAERETAAGPRPVRVVTRP